MKKSKNQEEFEETNPLNELFWGMDELLPNRKERTAPESKDPEDDPEYKKLKMEREARIEALKKKRGY